MGLAPQFDWAIATTGPDAGAALEEDDGLYTAVALSLFSDRVANAEDALPDNSGDRRGWWGDAYLELLPDGTADHFGSRLWLLARALATPETAVQAQDYCQEALDWLVQDGVAASVRVRAVWRQNNFLVLRITIAQTTPGVPPPRKFTFLWNRTFFPPQPKPAPAGAPIYEDSSGQVYEDDQGNIYETDN